MFARKLALKFQIFEVDSWLTNLDSQEFFNWYEFYLKCPGLFDDPWCQTGMVCSIVGNASPNRKKGSKPFTSRDFIPSYEVKTEVTLAEKKAEAAAFHELMKARYKKRKKGTK